MHMRPKEIAGWLERRLFAAAARGYVVGLSGGIDSAVVAGLCHMAAPGRVVAVIMPCHGDARDEVDARGIADHFNLPTARIDLAPTYDRLSADLSRAVAGFAEARPAAETDDESDIRARVPLANLKPRLRMASLYYIANSLEYLVAGTSNRCELTIGYFTKHGDGGADVLPIGSLLKSDVRALAQDLGVPEAVLQRPPSAGLWPGQTDEAEMGFSYSDLERYLDSGPDGVSPALALRIERMERRTEHKRTPPAVYEGE
jgi:NAD+ synthase